MHDPTPVDVLQVALFAGADEANGRHVACLAIVKGVAATPVGCEVRAGLLDQIGLVLPLLL